MAASQKQARYSVPIGGINTRDSVMLIGPEYGYIVNNMLARPTGLEVRRGYREWLPKTYSFTSEVRTLMFFSDPGNLSNRLFACPADANSPIYNITTPNVDPIAPFVGGTGATRPGEFSWVNTTTAASAFLLAQCHGLGYFNYTTTGGWVKIEDGTGAGKISFEAGVTTANMLFVFVFKNRVWFLEAGKARAWYLPVNAVTGVAKALELGKFLQNGGGFAFATSWTYDSGSGMDDNLIFVSNNGDMVIYEGNDPDVSTDFKIKGQWFIGRVPPGRRGYCQYGGDTLIITEYGIVSVSDMVSGRIVNPKDQSVVGGKYNPTLSRYVNDYITDFYWQITSYPSEELLYVTAPALDPDFNFQVGFTMGHFSKAWTTTSNIPTYSLVVYRGLMFAGAKNGKVYQMFSGSNDNASYDGTVAGTEVTGTFQTGFNAYETPSVNKRVSRVRLLGISDGQPSFLAYTRREYDFTYGVAATPNPPTNKSAWDVAQWDAATWQARSATMAKWFGLAGFGKKLALQVSIRGTGKTLITDYEVTYTEGIGL